MTLITNEKMQRWLFCKSAIRERLDAVREAGEMLREVNDNELYFVGGYDNFEECCEKEWNLCRSTAFHLIKCSDMIVDLSRRRDEKCLDIPLPQNKSQILELATVPEDKRLDAWEEASQNGNPSVRHIREIAKQYKDSSWTSGETARRKVIHGGGIALANMHNDKALISWAQSEGKLVKIDRNTIYGNAMKMEWMDNNREAVIEWFTECWLPFLIKKGHIDQLAQQASRNGLLLSCWCCPERCHGDVIIDAIIRRTTK